MAARLVVGVVFLAAGIAKLVAWERWLADAAGLGVRRRLAVVVPPAELGLGAAVVSGLWMPWSAVVAAGLLVCFTAVIVVNLASGRRPPCACFGAWSTASLSWWHVVRNLALMALLGVAVTV